MKRYFDTSVLIAAFVRTEEHHEACAKIVSQSRDSYVLTHGMVECFSGLTGGRISIQQSANEVARVIESNILERMNVVSLSPAETINVLKNAEKTGVRGGGIYDALHLEAARKCEAEEIYTLNIRHFKAFAPDLADRVKRPEPSPT